MILCIAEVLHPSQAADIAQRLQAARFEDGANSAGWAAQAAKRNEQLAADEPLLASLRQEISRALDGNETFLGAALPRTLGPVLFSRTGPGGGYGLHVDNALMGSPPLRTDLAFTLFISPPEAYEGGELVLDEPQGEQSFKLPAGHMVLYPATTLHRVETVRSHCRLVAAGWLQSLVRDASLRETLFELDLARRAIFLREGASATFHQVTRSHANLLRRYAET